MNKNDNSNSKGILRYFVKNKDHFETSNNLGKASLVPRDRVYKNRTPDYISRDSVNCAITAVLY